MGQMCITFLTGNIIETTWNRRKDQYYVRERLSGINTFTFYHRINIVKHFTNDIKYDVFIYFARAFHELQSRDIIIRHFQNGCH